MDPSQNESPQIVLDDEATALADRVPVDLDDWDLGDDFHVLQRLAESLRIEDAHPAVAAPPRYEQEPADPDLSTDQPPEPPTDHRHDSAIDHQCDLPTNQRDRCRKRKPSGALLAWAVLSLGLVIFVFGGALLAWSFVATRGDLWCWGMPLTLLGQALLLVGVVLQIDGLWQNNTQTAEALDELDEQIHGLCHTTTPSGSTHGLPAHSFHPHLAGGASPQMLLGDLKGQLDVLSMRLAQERR